MYPNESTPPPRPRLWRLRAYLSSFGLFQQNTIDRMTSEYQKLFLHSSGSWKSKVMVPGMFGWGLSFRPQTSCVLTWQKTGGKGALWSLCHKGINLIYKSVLMTYHLLKSPPSHRALVLEHEFRGDTSIQTIAEPNVAEMGSVHSSTDSLGVMANRTTSVFTFWSPDAYILLGRHCNTVALV